MSGTGTCVRGDEWTYEVYRGAEGVALTSRRNGWPLVAPDEKVIAEGASVAVLRLKAEAMCLPERSCWELCLDMAADKEREIEELARQIGAAWKENL